MEFAHVSYQHGGLIIPAMGANLPWGQGDTPIVECLQLIRDKKYNIMGAIEMEHPIPAGSDNWIELGKCIEFCKKALL